MKSYIWITFAFLGWGYYEASGGADFQPGSSNVQTASAVAAEAAPETDSAAVQTASTENTLQHKLETQLLATLRDERRVARMPQVSNVRTVAFRATDHSEMTPQPATFISTKGSATPAAETETDVVEVAVMEPSDIAPVATIRPKARPADLVAGTDLTPTATISTSGFVESSIAASSANLRMGPGTNYPVLTTLSRGSKVRVLRRGEDGWLKLKSLDDGRIGWMVDYLLSAS